MTLQASNESHYSPYHHNQLHALPLHNRLPPLHFKRWQCAPVPSRGTRGRGKPRGKANACALFLKFGGDDDGPPPMDVRGDGTGGGLTGTSS